MGSSASARRLDAGDGRAGQRFRRRDGRLCRSEPQSRDRRQRAAGRPRAKVSRAARRGDSQGRPGGSLSAHRRVSLGPLGAVDQLRHGRLRRGHAATGWPGIAIRRVDANGDGGMADPVDLLWINWKATATGTLYRSPAHDADPPIGEPALRRAFRLGGRAAFAR